MLWVHHGAAALTGAFIFNRLLQQRETCTQNLTCCFSLRQQTLRVATAKHSHPNAVSNMNRKSVPEHNRGDAKQLKLPPPDPALLRGISARCLLRHETLRRPRPASGQVI